MKLVCVEFAEFSCIATQSDPNSLLLGIFVMPIQGPWKSCLEGISGGQQSNLHPGDDTFPTTK